jgi:UDP-N-acetylmuramate dehydrogenase
VVNRLRAIPHLTILLDTPLANETRFGIGGPAAALCDAYKSESLSDVLRFLRASAVPHIVIGGGTNLVVSDDGFDGVVVRYSARAVKQDGDALEAEAGAVLQEVVDTSMKLGLEGLQTMTGIPGHLGGAVYGNAGAYGHSIQELVEEVRFVGETGMCTFSNADCEFRYRESIFKRRKDWIITSARLRFRAAEAAGLQKIADEIRAIRDAKYPPAMKCAGSIFKNVFFDDVPAAVQDEIPSKLVRDGKVPSAWFLEQSGVKGLRRGDIQVASYHANLIYNDGSGTATDLVWVIEEVKRRVYERFGFELEEEVQYVGFEYANTPA